MVSPSFLVQRSAVALLWQLHWLLLLLFSPALYCNENFILEYPLLIRKRSQLSELTWANGRKTCTQVATERKKTRTRWMKILSPRRRRWRPSASPMAQPPASIIVRPILTEGYQSSLLLRTVLTRCKRATAASTLPGGSRMENVRRRVEVFPVLCRRRHSLPSSTDIMSHDQPYFPISLQERRSASQEMVT